MRVRTLLAGSILVTAGVLLPAAPASACIHVYVPVFGSFCDPDPCPWFSEELGIQCK